MVKRTPSRAKKISVAWLAAFGFFLLLTLVLVTLSVTPNHPSTGPPPTPSSPTQTSGSPTGTGAPPTSPPPSSAPPTSAPPAAGAPDLTLWVVVSALGTAGAGVGAIISGVAALVTVRATGRQRGTGIRAVARNTPVTVKYEEPDPDGTIGSALDRLTRSGDPRAVQTANRLAEIGYRLVPASSRTPGKRPENYIRFEDPARPGPAVGYLYPTYFSFYRDRVQVRNISGGRVIPSTGEVAFSYEAPARGLQIAEMLKG
jgi:hypothetical protein